MSRNFVLCLAVFAAVALAVEERRTEERFRQEVDCSRVGGICLPRESCPEEKISQEGGCPRQRSLGAVCCHSLSITESRCEQLGGQCRDSCPESLTIARANDCDEGEKCCPLV